MIVLLLACTSQPESTSTDTRQQVLDDLVENVVLGSAEDFVAAARGLEAATSCSGSLEDAQAAFRAARIPWKQHEIVNFGPVVELPYRVGPKIDLWPLRVDDLIDVLEDSDADVSVAGVRAMGGATRGFPALEYLLFEDESWPEHCEYAASLAVDIREQSEVLRDGWRDDWAAKLTKTSDPYSTQQDVIDEWVNRMAFTVENIKADKLLGPLGDGSPALDLIESPYAESSVSDAVAALEGVERVFTGHGGAGLRDLIPRDQQHVVTTFASSYTASAERLARVPEPLANTVLVEPESIDPTLDALRLLQVAIQVDLAQALSVTLTFNDNDGD